MAVVNATIKNRITTVPSDVELVCNNPTDEIEINFDDEWSGKTGYVARFEWNGKYYDVPFTGTRVQVPELSNTAWIMFGVYADNITAAPAKVKCKKSILCYGDEVRQPPANPFYDEFVERLEDVEEAIEQGGGTVVSGVSSVNGKTGAVKLAAKDVGARPDTWMPTAEDVGAQPRGNYLTSESDPTVPAWAKQPTKPTYTAEEVGAMSADTEIPEAYTLPTASETVKGGVKVGEGLRMTGDALEVVPEPEYELIETIEVEEDVALLIRNGFRLKVMSIRARIAPSKGSGNMYIKYAFSGKGSITSYFLNAYSETNTRLGYSKVYTTNGRWRSGWWTCVNNHGEYANYYENPEGQEKIALADSPLTEVAISAQNGNIIPAGSLFEIWGVRA